MAGDDHQRRAERGRFEQAGKEQYTIDTVGLLFGQALAGQTDALGAGALVWVKIHCRVDIGDPTIGL